MSYEMAPKKKECLQSPKVLKRWIHLLLWLVCLWLFIFVLAPWMQQIPVVNKLSSYIKESDIDAGALYYTEVDEVGESDLAVRNTFRFYLQEQ
jgi:hypothetical protein